MLTATYFPVLYMFCISLSSIHIHVILFYWIENIPWPHFLGVSFGFGELIPIRIKKMHELFRNILGITCTNVCLQPLTSLSTTWLFETLWCICWPTRLVVSSKSVDMSVCVNGIAPLPFSHIIKELGSRQLVRPAGLVFRVWQLKVSQCIIKQGWKKHLSNPLNCLLK